MRNEDILVMFPTIVVVSRTSFNYTASVMWISIGFVVSLTVWTAMVLTHLGRLRRRIRDIEVLLASELSKRDQSIAEQRHDNYAHHFNRSRLRWWAAPIAMLFVRQPAATRTIHTWSQFSGSRTKSQENASSR